MIFETDYNHGVFITLIILLFIHTGQVNLYVDESADLHVGGILILKCVYPGIIYSFRFKINGKTATLESKYGPTCCSKEQNSTH